MKLRLRPVVATDEAAVRRADRIMAVEGFRFALGLTETMSFREWLDSLERLRFGIDVPEGFVPSTFLLAEVDGELVGRTSIRHRLNDFLAREGGNIGYAVLPEHRRRGHATEILRQAVIVARANGVERVLVTCDDDNVGSARVIEHNGGLLDSTVELDDGKLLRRYWID